MLPLMRVIWVTVVMDEVIDVGLPHRHQERRRTSFAGFHFDDQRRSRAQTLVPRQHLCLQKAFQERTLPHALTTDNYDSLLDNVCLDMEVFVSELLSREPVNDPNRLTGKDDNISAVVPRLS